MLKDPKQREELQKQLEQARKDRKNAQGDSSELAKTGGGADTSTPPSPMESDPRNKLKAAQRPMIIVGAGASAGALRASGKLAADAGVVREGWNGFNVLHSAASRVGGLDLGFLPGAGGKSAAEMLKGGMDTLFLLGVDEVALPKAGTIIYLGTHGDAGAHRADIILPGAAYPEKDATWVNTEGRVQVGNRAGFAPGDAREDWAIIRALSDVLGKKLPFDSLGELRQKLYAAHPHFADVDAIATGNGDEIAALGQKAGEMGKSVFASPVKDFYLTNPIARASAVMAECSALARNNFKAAAE